MRLRNSVRSLPAGHLSLYFFLVAAHAALVWLLPYFPSQDGPSHFYNLVILRDLLNGGKEWGTFFAYHLQLVPNLAFHLVAYPLLGCFQPLTVERLFLSLYIVLLGISVLVFIRTFHGPLFPVAYLSVPTIFNFNVLMGFYSYVITVPLFLLAVSLSWRIRHGSVLRRFIFSNIAGFVLFCLHLIPSVLYLMFLLAMSVGRSRGPKEIVREVAKLSAGLSPVLLNLFVYIGGAAAGRQTHFLSVTTASRFGPLLKDLFTFSTVAVSRWQMAPAAIFMFLTVLMLYHSCKELVERRRRGERLPDEIKTLGLLGLALTTTYLFAPFRLGGGSFFNQRFPWVILIIILPLLASSPAGLFRQYGVPLVAGTAILFTAVNAAVLRQQSEKVEQFLQGMDQGPPAGSYVMTYKEKKRQWSSVDPLMHAVSYYGMFLGCVDIGDYEVDYDLFFVRRAPSLPVFPDPDRIAYAPATIDFAAYPSIQYLIGWDVDAKNVGKLSAFYHLIGEDGRLTFWRRNEKDIR